MPARPAPPFGTSFRIGFPFICPKCKKRDNSFWSISNSTICDECENKIVDRTLAFILAIAFVGFMFLVW